MSISSEVRKAGPFAGNDVITDFPFSFKVFSTADVLVVRADSKGAEYKLELGTDYTVSLNANQNTSPGGTVVKASPLVTGDKIVITSRVANLQPTDLTNQGGFYPAVINAALDRATIQIQQLSEKVDRSAKLPITRTEDADALSSDIVVLADNLSSVNTVAGSIGSVNTVAGVSADVSTVAGNTANINAAVADLPALSAKVSKTGDTMTGPLSVPAGASGAQVPQAQEVVPRAGNVTMTGPLSVPAGASGAQVPQAQETYGPKNGQLAGMRNKIINGKMEIAQRGTSFSAIATSTYSLDRWFNGNSSGGVITISQQLDAPSSNEFQYSLRCEVTTADTTIAAGDYAFLSHRIEGFNARDLIGRTFTVSFWVRSSKTGAHCISLRNAGDDRSYIAEYTVNAANTWEKKSVTIAGGLITAGTQNFTNGKGLEVGFSLAAGTTYQTTANAWNTGNLLATANQVNCLDAVGNIFAITGVQLEVGEVATPFEHRPYGAELALCERYYQIRSFVLTVSNHTANSDWGYGVNWSGQMRAVPTVAVVTSGVTAGSGTPIVDNSTIHGARVRYTAGNTGANQMSGTISASIEL